ncbi:MAG: YcaO-like family protein [Spirochaetales bacterium]|nr:YcaO-like family protein [Spirochaetales bacterium]
MFEELKRPYKCNDPLGTIDRVRDILSSIDLFVYESSWCHPYKEVYSVSIMSENEQGHFRTNGKGRSRQFCLASAYAEYMERIQNGMISNDSYSRLFLNKLKQETGFFFFPDEKLMTREEFEALPQEYLNDIFVGIDQRPAIEKYFNRLKENGYKGCISVPFRDIINNCTIYLPHNFTQMLSGSNGMAAGNTFHEAVFQALCELLERYSASIIYYNQLTPPTIDREILKRFPGEYGIIEDIERSGEYEVYIKDFSCDKHLPSIGTLIINRKEKKYKLNVGSDTYFPVALSRSLTEIMQGMNTNLDFTRSLLPIPEKEHDYFIKDDVDSRKKRYGEYLKFTVNGLGVFPKTLFNTKESYSFDLETFTPCASYEEEGERLIGLIKGLGHNIYIRNCSFLGFPTCYIYIPYISPLGKKTQASINFTGMHSADKLEDLFFTGSYIKKTENGGQKAFLTDKKILSDITLILNNYPDSKLCDILRLEFLEDSDMSTMPVSFILTLFWSKLGNYSQAARNLGLFMAATNNENDDYYKAILQYLHHKTEHLDDTLIQLKMQQSGHDHDLIEEIINTFNDEKKLFSGIQFPLCPDCHCCQLKDQCMTTNKVNLSKKLIKAMHPVSAADVIHQNSQ